MAVSEADKCWMIVFWCERLIIISLTISWIYGCYNFLVYPEEHNFHFRTFACTRLSSLTIINMFYFFSYLSGRFPLNEEAVRLHIPDESKFSTKWDDVERLAFWNERVGMLFVLISIIVGLSYSTLLIMCFFPCIILFPSTNILYLEWILIFGKNKLKEHHHDESKEVKVEDHHDESKEEVKEESGKINETDRTNEGHIVFYLNKMPEGRVVPDLNKMPEFEEENEREDKFVVEQDDIIDKPTLEKEILVKEMNNTSEEKYRKKFEKFEKEWEIKLKNVKERYREKCKNWKQQENDLLLKLSSASSQVGFYQIQASDSEEKLRRLEDEKIELITKLTTANASSELYRSFLHDPSSTQQYWPSF